jgi:SAM-dependent methyltransferase
LTNGFDEKARTWDDDPDKVERARVVAAAVRAAVPLTSSMALLEYGAGTGLVAGDLAGDVGTVTLADTSAGMREVMTEKVHAGTLPPGARVWELDLSTGEVPDETFDLIVTVLTLHHIHDTRTVLEGFAQLLADGGHLCVVDLEQEDGSFHRDSPDFDGHHGFDRTELRREMETAGFSDVTFTVCHEIERNGARYPLFLATARRGRGTSAGRR